MSQKMEGDYECHWPHNGGCCGHKFTARFGRIVNQPGKVQGGGCSAVKCPKCGHNLKPVQDAIKLREIDDKKGALQNG